MSTSLLYHTFGLVGYDYVNTTSKGGRVIFTIRLSAELRQGASSQPGLGGKQVWSLCGEKRAIVSLRHCRG